MLIVVAHCFCVLLVVAHFQPSFFTVALYRPRKCKTNVMHILSMWNLIAKVRLNRDVVVLVQVLNTGIFFDGFT